MRQTVAMSVKRNVNYSIFLLHFVLVHKQKFKNSDKDNKGKYNLKQNFCSEQHVYAVTFFEYGTTFLTIRWSKYIGGLVEMRDFSFIYFSLIPFVKYKKIKNFYIYIYH